MLKICDAGKFDLLLSVHLCLKSTIQVVKFAHMYVVYTCTWGEIKAGCYLPGISIMLTVAKQ